MTPREELFESGVALAQNFCSANEIPMPAVHRLGPNERLYHLATCAFYRPTTIHIMFEKCANKGFGGRAWSWPGYVIDRTPYGVVQHELGHHIDGYRTEKAGSLFSQRIHGESKEAPLTGYLGTDRDTHTFYMEWFAENFRLFVTNSDLCRHLRPRFFHSMLRAGFKPVKVLPWEDALAHFSATPRIVDQARKKIDEAVASKGGAEEFRREFCGIWT